MRPEGRVAAGGRSALRAPFGSPLTFLGIAEKNDSNRVSGSQARMRAAAYAAKAKRAERPAPGV